MANLNQMKFAHFSGSYLLGLLFGLFTLFFSLNGFATIDAYQFENDVMRDRYQNLIAELRCPKCQNQNLAGSDSAVAQDLRREVYNQLIAGRSDMEIRQFMRERYGDFILYNPPLSGITLIVWLAPIFIFLVAALAGFSVVRSAMKVNKLKSEDD